MECKKIKNTIPVLIFYDGVGKMKLTTEEFWDLNDWLEGWINRFKTRELCWYPNTFRWQEAGFYNKDIFTIIKRVYDARHYIHGTSSEKKQKLQRENLFALTFVAEIQMEEYQRTGKIDIYSTNKEIWGKWCKQSEEITEPAPRSQPITKKKTKVVAPNFKKEYELGEPPITFEESLKIPVHGDESLFCDTEFLEQFFGKKIKKTNKCTK